MFPFTLITFTRRIPKGTRLNLKAHLSDMVTVKTAEIPYGNRVQVLPYADTLEGLTGNIFDTFLAPYFKQAFRPVQEGDRFIIHANMKSVCSLVEP